MISMISEVILGFVNVIELTWNEQLGEMGGMTANSQIKTLIENFL